MKVLMISEYFPPYSKGGGEISAFLLAKELSKKGVDVHVLTSHFDGLKKTEIVEKIKILRLLKTGENPGSIKGNLQRQMCFEKSLLKNLEDLSKKENYDIIHCMNTNSIVAVQLKHKLQIPFVLHVNGPVLFCPKGTLMYKDKELCEKNCTYSTYIDCFLHSKNIGKITMPFYIKYNLLIIRGARKKFEKYQELIFHFDHYMAISTFMEKRLVFSGVKEEKISIIYNLVDFDKFLKLKQPKNKIKKILYLGPYTKPKGSQILLESLKKVKEPFVAGFYGEGILEKFLIENSGKNIKINNSVSYSKIPKIIQEHDILVFPSLVGEAFGRVALEACAAGKIVIASNIGGIPDVIENNKTGFLFEPGNVDELSKLLGKAITNKVKISPEIIRKNIKQKFSSSNSVKKTIQTYRDLKNG